MDTGPDVTLWQGGVVEQDEQPESGPASHLFQETTRAFSSLSRTLIQDPNDLDPKFYNLLREEFRRFYLWNEGFCTGAGDLDQVLSSSKNLKGTVLNLMVLWARALFRIPRTMPQYDWTSVLATFAELEVLAYKVDQVARAAAIDMKSHCSVVSTFGIEYDSDPDSDTESSASDDNGDEIIEDMRAYMESLIDLSPSLDHPAMDSTIIENLGAAMIDDLSGISEPARPFALIIKDRFPSLEIGLVRKLGEANWERRQRLRQKLSVAPVVAGNFSLSDDNSSSGDTVVGRRRQIAPDDVTLASTVRSSLSVPSTYESITTGSAFSDPSIFDNQSISVPRTSRPYSFAESMTSFATSMADGLGYGQRRIPNMPDHDYDASFQCSICGDVLARIRHRADWKKHVYDDLEPYICLATDCTLGLRTFKSRGEWIKHEFQNHRVIPQWSCNLCAETFESDDLFQSHLHSLHFQDVAPFQIDEVISASKRIIPRDGTAENCPFCLTIPATTQKAFASHVGKHLQEISLAALPNLDESDEDGGSGESDGGDDDHSEIAGDEEETEDGSPKSDRRSSDSEGSIETVKNHQEMPHSNEPLNLSLPAERDENEVPDQAAVAMTDDQWWERIAEMDGARWTRPPPSTPPPLPASPSGSSSLSVGPIGLNDTSSTFDGNLGSDAPSVSPPQLRESSDTPSHGVARASSQQFHLPTSASHKHSLSRDSQTVFTFTLASQNRLTSIAKDFQKALGQCVNLVESTPVVVSEQMPLLLASIANELRILTELNNRLTVSSSMLPSYTIEKAIETLAICRTQIFRIQRFLESTITNLEALQKKGKRQSRGFSRLFRRPASTDVPDISKGETILTDVRTGRSVLASIIPVASQQSSEASPSRLSGHDFLEAFDPRIRGRISHDFDAPRPRETFPQNETLNDLPRIDRENSISHSRLTSELLESRFQENTGIVSDETGTAPELLSELDPNTGKFPTYRAEEVIDVPSAIGPLIEATAPDANRIENRNEDQIGDTLSKDDEDDITYQCKGCGDILEEGKAFELDGNHWHIYCFRCNTCGTLLDSDADLLLLGDGSLICNDCRYSCSACSKKIEDLMILTGDQAFCASCFRCRNCKQNIQNLRYTQTSKGIFCMVCHESLMARRRNEDKGTADTMASSQSAQSKRNTFGAVSSFLPIYSSLATRPQQELDNSRAESSKINDAVDADHES